MTQDTKREALIEAAQAALMFLETAPLESGYCCCGDKVEAHNMGSGHSPVDDLAYHASGVADTLRAALSTHPTPTAEQGGELVKRLASIAECAFDDRPRSRSGHHSEMDWTDGYRDGTRAAAAAILATLTKSNGDPA